MPFAIRPPLSGTMIGGVIARLLALLSGKVPMAFNGIGVTARSQLSQQCNQQNTLRGLIMTGQVF
jgi:hypothetical protein